jgi:hypothetical protein
MLMVQTYLKFAGSDMKWEKQSFHLLKPDPLNCGGTQKRILWSRSVVCSRIVVLVWSASCILCKHFEVIFEYFAFKEGQVLEFSNLSIVLKEACLCYEIVKLILNSDRYYKREISGQIGLDSGWT